MSAETNLWNRLRTNMVGKYWAEATRHEDKFQKGIADVSFCQAGVAGWMELKHISQWPARATTKVRIPHYSIEQKEFLERKGKAMGNTWLFIQVEGDFLLYSHLPAQFLPDKTKTEMVELSTFFYEGRLDYARFAHDMAQWVEYVGAG